MELKKPNYVLIVLGVVSILSVLLSGYLFFQSQDYKNQLADKDTSIKNLNFKLRSPRFNYRIENTKVVNLNSSKGEITVKDDAGKDLTLVTTSDSKIEEIVLSENKQYKNWKESSLDKITKDSTISVLFNGLNEVVSLSFAKSNI